MRQHMLASGQAALLAENGGCSVYQFKNETGEGTITIYEVFPGMALAFNDFHMQYYDSEFRPGRDVFCIDYCREGVWSTRRKTMRSPMWRQAI